LNAIDTYARSVVDGTIPGGKYHRLACQRHLNDREVERTDPAYPFRFDVAHADRFVRFAEKLKHYKGKQWAGKPILLSPCQQFRLGCVFGWRKVSTGLRRFTTAYNELPRKQGKSLEAAIVALYVTFFEGEQGAEGYCIATKRDQAKIVFQDARKLVMSSGLRERIKVNRWNLHRAATESKLEPLGADADSTDGLNPSLIITDEFHAQKDRGLLDVMESATGARLEFLNFQITTAGDDPVSPCGDQHDYACKILDGILVDDSTDAFFAFIAHADPQDDWLDERTWAKANPHYGLSVNPEDMRKLALKAKHMPSAAAEFKQKRLNLWVNTDEPWLSMDGWRKGQTAGQWVDDDLKHEPCYIGIDLASKIDLCALVALFPPGVGHPMWRILRWVWTPEETLIERARRDRAPYDVWVQQGHLLTTPGTRIDHAVIRDTIATLRPLYDIEAIGFDPWHADKLIDELVTEDGFSAEQVIAVPQTYAGMSSACKSFEAEVLGGEVDARGCPLMGWSLSNAVAQRDGKDNLFPVKKRSKGRIDPLMATIIARRLVIAAPDTSSVYLTRGVRVLGQ
jgi:phage terminase large subunit-like protein